MYFSIAIFHLWDVSILRVVGEMPDSGSPRKSVQTFSQRPKGKSNSENQERTFQSIHTGKTKQISFRSFVFSDTDKTYYIGKWDGVRNMHSYH
jgi:hypothetical protein